MTTYTQHIIKPSDRDRIRCEDCGRRSFVCLHAHWNTGNTKGLSFWYFCKRDGKARGAKV